MVNYIVKRIGQAIIVMFLAALLTFILVNIAPGDPVHVMLEKRADAQTIERVRHQLGLDLPLPVQFFNLIKGVVRGDLGDSYFQRQPVTQIVGKGFKLTARLGLSALLVSTVVGLVNWYLRSGMAREMVRQAAYVYCHAGHFRTGFLDSRYYAACIRTKAELVPDFRNL